MKTMVKRERKRNPEHFKNSGSIPDNEAEQEEPLEDSPARVEEADRSKEGHESDASSNLYFREIGRTNLLTPEEEAELAGRIQNGDQEAREEMINANLRLVVTIARDYEGYGLPLLDLINEGNIGLMKAVERFDPKKGAKLSTYGVWWIKQSIKHALAHQSKTIRLPIHMLEKCWKMRQAANRLQDNLGREPTDEELAAEVELTREQVNQCRMVAKRPSSLEAPIGDGETGTLGELLPDNTATTPYMQLEEKVNNEMLEVMIEALEPREATTLKYRFGLQRANRRTLEEIGQHLGVTRERVRQIETMALSKLRRMFEDADTVSSGT